MRSFSLSSAVDLGSLVSLRQGTTSVVFSPVNGSHFRVQCLSSIAQSRYHPNSFVCTTTGEQAFSFSHGSLNPKICWNRGVLQWNDRPNCWYESQVIFSLFLDRLNQSSSPTAIGTLVYAYLIDCRRRLSIEQLFYQNFPTSINESKPVKIDDNGGVCITNPDLSSTPYSKFELSFDKTPVWADVLPGQYSVTCQLQLRRRVREHILWKSKTVLI